MAVWMRRGAWALGGLVLVLAALAAWFIATFDGERVKALAIDWMQTQRQRTLVINGPVRLSVFPRLAVKLSQLTLSERGRPDTFAALDDAALAVDVLPLLRGEVVVGRIEARGVRVTIVRDAKGRGNFDDLAQRDTSEQAPAERKAMRMDVSGIALSDVKARVKDAQNGVDGELLLRSLETGRIAHGVEAPVKVDARFDFAQPRLQGDLKGSTRVTPDLDTRSAALRGIDLGFKGDTPAARAVDAHLKGDLAWDGASRSVDAKALELQLSAQAGAAQLAGSTISAQRFAFDPAKKTLALRALQARLRGSQGGQPFALELDWPELDARGDTLAGSAFSGKASRGGALPLEASFKSAAPSGNFDAVRLPGFEARITSRAAQRSLDGTLRSDLTLKPSPFALALDRLDLQARIEQPKLAPMALALRGSAVAAAQRSTWNVAGQLEGNSFASEGSVALAGAVPQVIAKARFDALDLNRLLGPAAAASAPAAPAKGGAAEPVDLGALRSVNGQFNLRAGSLAFRQYRIADAALDAVLDAGVLRVTTLSGKAWGGQLNANALADARANRVAIKGTASGVNVNALVKDVAAKDLIEGTGRVSFDLDSVGRSVSELKSHLKGSSALQVRDGAIKGINLAKSLRQAKAALSLKQDAVQKASQSEKTDFSELSATFQIADGVARNRDLDMKSPFVRLGGEGAIDIGRSRLDYLARATVVATSQGQDAELAALKGVTVPVRLSGPLDAPEWKIEWSGVAADVVARKLEEKLGEKLGLKAPSGAASQPSTSDQIKKTLRGLFK